jgi:hypothetical protein
MGGVGKTTIARQYANNARDRFDAIFWISADNMTKMTQNFLEVAQKLGLIPENRKTEDAVAAMSKVKSWLAETSELSNFDKKSFELIPVQTVVGFWFSTMRTIWRS